MLLLDLEQDAHFIKTAAKGQEGFDLLLLSRIFAGCKHGQKRLLSCPETVGGPLPEESQLGCQVLRLSFASEFVQFPELSIVLSGQMPEVLKMVGSMLQGFASFPNLDEFLTDR
jgi:hypothetical protein